jgi:small subunit ribosomal protein S11
LGKKRIATSLEAGRESGKSAENLDVVGKKSQKTSRKHVLRGIIYIFSSYNNTIVTVADPSGDVFAHSSAGTIGFKGARKSTPYAATLVGKDAVEKAKRFGFQEAKISIRGVGPGREAAIRGIASAGINITAIIDATPMPHNGVRPAKPRRV